MSEIQLTLGAVSRSRPRTVWTKTGSSVLGQFHGLKNETMTRRLDTQTAYYVPELYTFQLILSLIHI